MLITVSYFLLILLIFKYVNVILKLVRIDGRSFLFHVKTTESIYTKLYSNIAYTLEKHIGNYEKRQPTYMQAGRHCDICFFNIPTLW